MATWTVSICREWTPWTAGKSNPAKLEILGEFGSEAEAKIALETELTSLYGDNWLYQGQYVHKSGSAGDPVVGWIHPNYSEAEKRERRIKELEETISKAQTEPDNLYSAIGYHE